MKLRPLGKNVLIQPVEARKVSAGGIVLPQGEKTGAREGVIVAAANGVELEPGARVLFPKHIGHDAGEGRVLVSADDVMAVIG